MDDLAQRAGVNVRYDERKTVETSVLPETPISCHLPSLPLKLALRRLLEVETLASAGLAWTIREECLVLTTQDEVAAEREVDLFWMSEGWQGQERTERLLANTI